MSELPVLYILEPDDLTIVGVIDDYYSLLWVERAFEAGEFVLELPIGYLGRDFVKTGYFILNPDAIIDEPPNVPVQHGETQRFMVIRDINPDKTEDSDKLILEGPSGESLLADRVFTEVLIYDESQSTLYEFVRDLLNVNCTDPTNPLRRIPFMNHILGNLVGISLGIKESFEPTTVYDVITYLCYNAGIEFKVSLNYQDQSITVLFYLGNDRSYDQITNPFVIFADDYNNVIASSFRLGTRNSKTVAYTVTNDEITSLQVLTSYFGDEPMGFNRKEMLITGSAISRDGGVTDADAEDIIIGRGLYELDQMGPKGVFEGQVDVNTSFLYGKDFFLSDIVSCEFGIGYTRALISEIVRSYNDEAIKQYISFDFDV